MLDNDDSFLNDYLAESRENLADIETNLLAIESGGADIDETLVNKVFRAAHSIKGGAGFFSLSKIQELGHRTENALDLIRSREMVPTPDVVNILLMAFDRLREMINNPGESQNMDNAELLVALAGLVSANLPDAKKTSLVKMVHVTAPGVKVVMSIPEFDFERAKENDHYLYLVEYDLIDDVQRRGKRPTDMMFILENTGTIVEAVFDLDTVGTLDDEPSSRLPFYILFSTELGPDTSEIVFDLPARQIHLIHSPLQKPAPVPAPAPEPEQHAEPEAEPRLEAAPAAQPRAAAAQAAHPAAAPAAAASAVSETTLRVEVGLLETLMNLASELVLSRNQLLNALGSNDHHSMQAGAQRITLVTSELQEAIMQTRMQPIGNIFNKFPRVVRDLSHELGKEVDLEIFGREVEMDKTIIEGLSEPLTHMVRNSVDHGIEMPEVRQRAGKPRNGSIRLKARHEAGQVVVEVSDDGRGIDPQAIARSAVAKGIVTQDQVAAMSLKEMTFLIFRPGLSTAEKVSDVSGRGVGMDVVKTNIDKLGGEIEIKTEVGKGTTFIIKMPLTLAIIPVLLVSVNHERFAIPQVHIDELIHIEAEQVKERIEVVGGAEVLILRGSLIPLVRLADALEIDRRYLDPSSGEILSDRRERIADRRSPSQTLEGFLTSAAPSAERLTSRAAGDRRTSLDSGLNIVVLNSGALQYGLIVDELHETLEIVVKPLGRHLKHLREYAGATVLGDGQVALILDVAGIAAKEALISMAGSQRAQQLESQERMEFQQAFLTFRNSPQEHCSVPLDLVSRVLQVQNEQVEWVGGRRTMQYRGASLPLVTLRDAANVAELQDDQEKAVVVFNVAGREVGLLAGMPVDVVESLGVIDQETLRQKGVLGSLILDNNTTLVANIYELVEAVYPEWVVHAPPPPVRAPAAQPLAAGFPGEASVAAPAEDPGASLVLLAEDSDFFRNQVRRYVEEGGYTVIAAADGQAALELLQQNIGRVCLVLTDVEMPRMDGLSLTRAIRADPRTAALPVLALTSLAGEEDIARGKAAGVNDYQIKLDRAKLLEGISALLQRTAASA